MGIQGLLRNLHPLLVPPPTHHSNKNNNSNNNAASIKIQHNIRQFANKSLAIDASSWLHKAGYTCSAKLVESIENNTRDPHAEKCYSDYIIRRCESLLRDAKISSIYLVFDGVRVPLKSGTNANRENKRQLNLQEARRLMSIGRRKEADEKYKLCVKSTELMARVVCGAVQRKWGKHGPVKCVFAPYEADSQLAKLCVDGITHAVVTEDSDVLVYSAVCRKPFPIIYKLDKKDGSCDVVTMDWLLNDKFLPSSSCGGGKKNGGRRRRRNGVENDDDDDSSSSSSSDDDEDEPTTMQVGEKKVKVVANSTMGDDEVHPSEVDYGDDNNMLFAPIRRTLPLPSSSINNGGGRSKKKATGSEFLSYLRAIANREVTNPGAGVRLFVQACVLSGCDYVANRLSKVGPIGAFKLVKENAHRDPSVRFVRILRGAKIAADVTSDKDSEDCDDDFAGDDFLDSIFPSGSDDERREKYEELLSQSEVVFYHHLVKEADTDEIVPLVAHKSEDDNKVNNLKVGEKFKPCLKRFESGLAFVGSPEEALKRCHKPAPPIQTSTGGWMTTARSKAFVNNNKPANKSQHPIKAAAPAPVLQKKTALDKFLAGGNGRSTLGGTKSLSNNKRAGTGLKLNNKPTAKGTSWSTLSKRKPSAQSIPKNNPYESLAKTTVATASDKSSAEEEKANPFAQFAHNDSKPKLQKTPVNTRPKGSNQNLASPFFSPNAAVGMNFDYGVPSVSKPKCVKQSLQDQSIECTEVKENESVALEPSELDDGGTESTLQETNEARGAVVKRTNHEFEYVVTESPPTRPSKKRNKSNYFNQTNKEDGLPRRVSASPPEHFKSDEMLSRSVDIIDLVDDSNHAENVLNERKPNTPVKSAPKTSSSVMNTSFKRPYLIDPKDRQSTKRKASAILAGFERQKEISEPRQQFSSTSRPLLGQKKSVAPKSTLKKRPTKSSSLKDFFGDRERDY